MDLTELSAELVKHEDVILVGAAIVWAVPPSLEFVGEHPFKTAFTIGTSIAVTKVCADLASNHLPTSARGLVPALVLVSAGWFVWTRFVRPALQPVPQPQAHVDVE